jgi:hypothetical protein
VVAFIIVVFAIAGGIWIARKTRPGRVSLSPTHRPPALPVSEDARGGAARERDSFDAGDTFFCDTARSPDGRYLVGARDGFVDERGRRHRGACALKDVRSGALCFKQPITRGNNPHVSNGGQVIVEDWKDQNLSGALIALDCSGVRLWDRHFRANIFTSDLSADGRRAFVSTCNSDHEPHSGKTFLLDASTGGTLWTRDGWGDVSFDGDGLVAELKDSDGSKHRFPFNDTGQLPSAYYEASVRIQGHKERGQYWALLPKIHVALTGPAPDLATAKRLLTEIDGKEQDMPASSRAQLLRLRGEVTEHEGDTARTLDYWRQALLLDPKVGIKRRYDVLSRGISSP